MHEKNKKNARKNFPLSNLKMFLSLILFNYKFNML